MPQMAPISWLVLFFVFSLTFIMFNVFNYYCFFNKKINNNEQKLLSNENKKLIWKW